MSKLQPTTEGAKTVKNRSGFFIPSSQQEHLKWWLHQIPFMQVSTPCSDHLTMYVNACRHEANTTPVPDEIRSNFGLKVFEKRMTSLGMIATPWLAVFIAGICENPAEAVMWSFFLKVHSIATNSNLLSLQDLGIIFPKGLPTPAGMEWMWNLQKLGKDAVGSDNLLDCVRMRPNET